MKFPQLIFNKEAYQEFFFFIMVEIGLQSGSRFNKVYDRYLYWSFNWLLFEHSTIYIVSTRISSTQAQFDRTRCIIFSMCYNPLHPQGYTRVLSTYTKMYKYCKGDFREQQKND